MRLSVSQRTLFESARAEAKRVGHQEASLLHLAAVLAHREPARFENAFGEGAAETLRRRLRAGSVGDAGGVDQFLDALETDDVDAILDSLRARVDLGGEPGRPRDSGPAATAHAEHAEQAATASTSLEGTAGLLDPVVPDARMVGRDAVVSELIALLGRQVPATPLLVGPGGGGNTSLASALATALVEDGYSGPLAGAAVVRVRTSDLLARDPVAALAYALESVPAGAILVVDDVEVITGMGSGRPIMSMLAILRAAVEDPAIRTLLVIEERFVARVDAADEELAGEVTRVAVPPLAEADLAGIAEERARQLAAHHGVEMSEEAIAVALAPAGPGEDRSHPGLLVERLDMACVRAALRPDRLVRAEDVLLTEATDHVEVTGDALAHRLRERVQGQDHAVERVCARLALTRAQLDLRPDRPDGVFLFVGPTGVGKTEMAHAICAEVFGDENRVIRLDMSEYAHDWALSRLIGPQPGYVGYTEPEGWLTTRIRGTPETVLLLDEIEKSHPRVWNAFLQVFDAGRLSDARGHVADFSRAVIVMTSNLGARAVGAPGFVRTNGLQSSADEDAVLAAVRDAMPPELVNRLDDVIVFRPLLPATIRSIAVTEISKVVRRLAERGYRVEVADAVVEHLANTGYDPAYGARHLQRNIERLLLGPLAVSGERHVRASVVDDSIAFSPAVTSMEPADGPDRPL